VFFILMQIFCGLNELSNLMFNCCNGLGRAISRTFKCLFWRNGRGSCLYTKWLEQHTMVSPLSNATMYLPWPTAFVT
jgi:hypothetical protein